MKRSTIGFWLCTLLAGSSSSLFGQEDRQEVPGDHFSLEGALELFKKSSSPEDFERLLNSQGSQVNNLDLNGDGDIDYIRVIDRHEGNIHTFTLQAVVSPKESQDVAVIELEKLADGKAILQITGDSDIYGMETIIEPTEEVRINAGTTTQQVVVNVWTWPTVQYVYGPYYSAWVSPWAWGYHPVWWRPWRPVAFYVYDPWWRPYRPYYAYCHSHRIVYAPRIYQPYRCSSVIVYDRHRDQLTSYRSRRETDYDNNRGRTHAGRFDQASSRAENERGRWISDNYQGRTERSRDNSSMDNSSSKGRWMSEDNDRIERTRDNGADESSNVERWNNQKRSNNESRTRSVPTFDNDRSHRRESTQKPAFRSNDNGSSRQNHVQSGGNSRQVRPTVPGGGNNRSGGGAIQRSGTSNPGKSSGNKRGRE